MNKLQPIKSLLSSIPAVHEIQKISEVQNLINIHGHNLVTQAIRTTQNDFRKLFLSSESLKNIKIKKLEFVNQLKKNLSLLTNDSLQRIFNLTGTVLHTNFGRALLSKEVINSIIKIASEPSNLEYDILNNKRGDRDSHIDERLCRLIGAEACTVVNNNAAAVVLVLNSLAKRNYYLRRRNSAQRGVCIIGGRRSGRPHVCV